MDNQSNQRSPGPFLPLGHPYNIWGAGSGNYGSHNQINSGNFNTTLNINYNSGGTNPSQNYTEISRCLYTSDYKLHRRRIARPAEGTCIWVTRHQKYTEWLEKKTPGLLWLSADPGSGKSVIASFLVDHLGVQADTIICYFFFNEDSEEQRSGAFALSAILHQLFAQRKHLRGYAQEAFEDKGDRFTKEVDTLWNILVRAASECGDVICVVDGLDECEEDTRTQLISHMTAFAGRQTYNAPLKFFVTSRPYYTIEKGLGAHVATIRLKGEDEVDAITADVTRLIDKGIEDLEAFWKQSGKLGKLHDLLMSSADRTFLWVSLILKTLKENRTGSPGALIHLATTLPNTMDELYTKILSKSTDWKNARRVLHIVVAAERPLTVEEMNVALTIKPDHKSENHLRDGLYPRFDLTVKDWCGLFVRVIDSKIYLVHQTAREFLIKGSLPSEGEWQYTLCPMDSNFILADICITYLSLDDFENDPFTVDTSGNATMEAQKYTLLDYAASHWARHFRKSQDRQIDLFESTKLICKGGTNRFLAWFKVYWGNSARYYP